MVSYKKLLTLKETAEILNVTQTTLRRWDKDGVLVAVRIGTGRHRRYKREDIDKLLKKQQ